MDGLLKKYVHQILSQIMKRYLILLNDYFVCQTDWILSKTVDALACCLFYGMRCRQINKKPVWQLR